MHCDSAESVYRSFISLLCIDFHSLQDSPTDKFIAGFLIFFITLSKFANIIKWDKRKYSVIAGKKEIYYLCVHIISMYFLSFHQFLKSYVELAVLAVIVT